MKKVFFLAILSLGLMAFSISEKLDKKVDKTIENYFETDGFTKEFVSFSHDERSSLPADFDKRFFKISEAAGLLGYAYVGNARSKTATFDYVILFDKEYVVMKSKVLIYREEYGGEIGSKRWLKQFIGKSSSSEELIPMQNISAISGATISVRSMTQAVNNVLNSLGQLQKMGSL